MRVLLSGGGTAGHINPALSIAAIIKEKYPDSKIAFVGTPTGMENKLVSRAGYEIFHVDVKGFKRKKSLGAMVSNAEALVKAVTSPIKAGKIIKSFCPDIVIGTGGYVSWPVLKAAAKRGIPTAIHEQNAVIGVTTKMLSRIVDKVMISFEESSGQFDTDKDKIVFVGNPVNPEMLKINREEERRKLSLDTPYLLSYGGSLGAKAVNNVVFDVIEKGDVAKIAKHTHGVGSYEWNERKEEIEKRKLSQKKGVELLEYIYDMPSKMAAADLVVSRAGAITLAELAVLHKPAILIPSPNVTNNHQYKNALVVAKAGGAVLIEEKDLTSERLSNEIISILTDKERLSKMSSAMADLAVYDTSERIFEVIKKLTER